MKRPTMSPRFLSSGSDTYAPEADLPQVDAIPAWKVAVFMVAGMVVFTFACAVMP